jgi:hypothetical protein
MKYYSRTLIMLFSIVLTGKCAIAQPNLDSFLNTLHNTDMRLDLAFVAPHERYDTATKYPYFSTIERVVTSVDMSYLMTSFPRYSLIKGLVRLLDDPDRDWYANLLLYDFARESTAKYMAFDTREKWLRPMPDTTVTYKQTDVEMWRKYLAGLSPSGK